MTYKSQRERMKNFLKLSVVAIFAVLPTVVNAEAVAGDPGATDASAPVAAHSPKYSLAESDGSDTGLATAGYVKGAYNAAIKAVNTVATAVDGKQDALTPPQLNAINSGITAAKVTEYDKLVTANGEFATKDGVLATIGDTTVTSQFTNGSVTGTVSSTFSNGVVSGGVTLPIVSTWGATTATNVAYANSVNGTATGDVGSSFSGGTVTGTVTSTVSAPAQYNDGTSGEKSE